MHPENVWEWLDAVDQDHLDPLDQWGIPPPPRPPWNTPPRSDSLTHSSEGETYQQYNEMRNAEAASLLKAMPPAGILLRNGSIRVTQQNPRFFAWDVKNENHPQSLLPGFPTSLAPDAENKNNPMSLGPGFPASSVATGERTDTSSPRELQVSGREGNERLKNPKRLPGSVGRSRDLGHSGSLHSIPTIHVEVRDPVAINCQGARVVGGHQQNGLQSLPRTLSGDPRTGPIETPTFYYRGALEFYTKTAGTLQSRCPRTMDLANEHNDLVYLRQALSYSSILSSHTQPKTSDAEAALEFKFKSDKYPETRKNKSAPQQHELSMSLSSTNLSPQITAASSPKPISDPPKKLRRVASKLFHQKIKLPIMDKEDINLPAELGSTGIIMQAARFVTFFIRPTTTTEAPRAQIVDDLKATTTIMTRTIIRPPPPQPAPRIYTQDYYYSTLPPPPPRSQTDLLNGPELRRQKSFHSTPRRSPPTTETGTPLRRNPQQVFFVFEATSDRSAEAVLDDVVDCGGYYERLDDEEGSDVDWSLLDLPEKV
ncbi:MAG: hypothetical protein ASARMPREDX12_001172 [Alectoria sarmentosa]|nr:MAG: hypothetical protein ASARMPREDX12_001172 [Alectoria sarmentosa]